LMIREIRAKTVLHHHDRTFATNWDVNPYRGCGHKCRYCFARYSHKYLDAGDFFDDIFVKTNVAEVLDRELSKPSWRRDPICLSGITDCYQPLEERYELMPGTLDLMIKHRNPIAITTKSDLILRDLDRVRELAGITDVIVSTSITSLDPELDRILEPVAPPASERVRMLGKMAEAGCSTSILLMPIMPGINDDPEGIAKIVLKARDLGIDRIIPGCLHLRGQVKGHFMSFLKDAYPDLVEDYKRYYRGSYLDRTVSGPIMGMIGRLKARYDMDEPFKPLLRPGVLYETKLEDFCWMT